MSQEEQKFIRNRICAFTGCTKLATTRVTTQLGFSAKFCDKCADRMISEGLGKR